MASAFIARNPAIDRQQFPIKNYYPQSVGMCRTMNQGGAEVM